MILRLVECVFLRPFYTDYVNGGELFMHLYRRERFQDSEVKFYIGEIAVALDILHKVR